MTYREREPTTEIRTRVESDRGIEARHVHQPAGDPYAAYLDRRAALFRWTQAIYLVFGVIEGLVAIRFVLRLFGANPAAPFTEFLYGITDPFVAPFYGVFGTPQVNGNILEPHSLLAIAVYALLAWLLVRLAWLLLDTRRPHPHEGEPPVA